MTEISVVIPLDDARGDAIEHLRTWSYGQSLERDRYQLVLVSDGTDPDGDERLAQLLQPHDRLLKAPGAGLIGLWNRGVREADADWVFLTENHVEALPDTMEQALAGIGETAGLDAASIEHGHLVPTPIGELGARWFDEVYAEWYTPGSWRRLNLAGYLIRRPVFDAVGGLDDRYGLFAAPLLSARLAEGGFRVGHFPACRILHVQNELISEHHGHTENYARGECEARLSLEREFAERYFGHQHPVWNRHRFDPRVARTRAGVVGREAIRELPRHPRRAGALLGELVRGGPPLAGSRLALAAARARLALTERVASAEWLPAERRYPVYRRAHRDATSVGQLQWIHERHGDGGARLREGEAGIEALAEGALIGMHGLERHDGRAFRWSEPLLSIRVEPAAGPRELRLDTGGLRGAAAGALLAAYAGRPGEKVAARGEGAELVVPVPAGADAVTLLFDRLHAPGESRRLGLPVFSLELGSGAPASAPLRPATPQPVG